MAACKHLICVQYIITPLQPQSDHVEQSAILNGGKEGIKDRMEELRGFWWQNVKSISSLCLLYFYSHQSRIAGPLCMCMCVHMCVCVFYISFLFYPKLREANRRRRSKSIGLGGPLVGDAALPLLEDPRFETVALSEYIGMMSNWCSSSTSSCICVSSSSSSFSTTWQGVQSAIKKCCVNFSKLKGAASYNN